MVEAEKITAQEIEHGQAHQELSADEILLQSLGYKQDLNRSISGFSNFAIAFSCCSVLSGLCPLWGLTLADAGSMGVIWGWFFTGLFTFLVSLSLAEICSAYPTTGGLYFWVSRLATADWVPLACWMTGWTNWIGLCFAITSVDLGFSQFIAGIITALNPAIELSVYAQYGIFVGIIIIHGIINSVAVKYNGIMNQGSFYANMIGLVLIIIVGLALTKPLASGQFVFTQFSNNSGFDNNGYAFLLVILQAQYTLSGYDSAAHMSEETHNSQKGSPYGMLVSVAANALSGFVFLIACSFMIQDFDTQILGENAIDPQMIQVFLDGVGQAWTIVFVVFIMISLFFSGSALVLGSSRMVYAFARDGAMPFSKQLHTLNKKTQSPVFAVWFNIVIAGIIGILFMINSTAYTAIVSVNTIGSQMSYLIPILLRITTSRTKFQPGPFNLGRFSIINGWISSAWLLFTCILFVLPTSWPVTPDTMNYAIVPFAFIMIVSMTYFYFWGRKWFTGPVRMVDGKEIILDDESIHSFRLSQHSKSEL